DAARVAPGTHRLLLPRVRIPESDRTEQAAHPGGQGLAIRGERDRPDDVGRRPVVLFRRVGLCLSAATLPVVVAPGEVAQLQGAARGGLEQLARPGAVVVQDPDGLAELGGVLLAA